MGNAPAYTAGAALIVGAAGFGIWKVRRWARRQAWLVSLARFLSGWRQDGRPGRPRRAGIRCGTVAAAIMLVACWVANPQVTGWAIVCLLFASLGLGAWWCWRWAWSFKHRRTWLRPAHLAAHRVAEIDPRRAPQEWLTVAADRSEAVAELPAGWNGDVDTLAGTLARTLGMGSPDISTHLAGPKPTLTLTAPKPPPAAVSLAQLRPFIDAAGPDEVVLGLGSLGKPDSVDLDDDSAHIGISAGSGGGKSVTSRLILAQRLYKGDIGLVLDAPKRISHMWARGLPNVVYCREVEEVHEALLWLARECDSRNRAADDMADIDGRVTARVGPRIVVVAEELNTLMKRLRAYWQKCGGTGRSPALNALEELLDVGRQVRITVVMIGQRLSNRATGGGGDARENLAALILARYRASTWKMLVPDLPMPPRTAHKLRVQVVTDEARPVQVALLTGREARGLALAGTVCPLPGSMRHLGVTGYGHEAIGGPDLGGVTQQPGIPPISPPPVTGLVTVREAIRAGLLPEGTTPEAVKQAAYRDRQRPEEERVFPAHKGTRKLAKLYDAAELEDWGAARR